MNKEILTKIMEKIKKAVVDYNKSLQFNDEDCINFYAGKLRGLVECAAIMDVAVTYKINGYLDVLRVEYNGNITTHSTYGWTYLLDVDWGF